MSTIAAPLNDLRLALRRLWRHPGYALGVVLTLALGIGVCAAMYSVVHGVVMRGLDYPQADRLVVLGSANTATGGEPGGLSLAEVDALAGPLPSIESSGYYFWDGATWLGGEHPKMISAIQVGGEFFRTLGTRPALGRWITPADQTPEGAVMLSHALWLELFDGDPDVVGRMFRMDPISAPIVGVMPEDFGYPARGVGIWLAHEDSALRAQPAIAINARFLFGILLGRWRRNEHVDIHEARQVTLRLLAHHRRFGCAIDGELAPLARETRLVILPGALKVLRPAPAG